MIQQGRPLFKMHIFYISRNTNIHGQVSMGMILKRRNQMPNLTSPQQFGAIKKAYSEQHQNDSLWYLATFFAITWVAHLACRESRGTSRRSAPSVVGGNSKGRPIGHWPWLSHPVSSFEMVDKATETARINNKNGLHRKSAIQEFIVLLIAAWESPFQQQLVTRQ